MAEHEHLAVAVRPGKLVVADGTVPFGLFQSSE